MSATTENLKTLLAVGESLLQPPRTNTFGFGAWDHGDYACLVGHYQRQTRVNFRLGGAPYYEADVGGLCHHFGISGQQAYALFHSMFGAPADVPGDAAYAELEKRLVFLRMLIAQREQAELRAAREAAMFDVRPIPAVVLDIFAARNVEPETLPHFEEVTA